MTTNSSEGQAPQAAYDMALWQLTEQMRSIEALDTKASGALTASLAFAGLFGAGVTLAIDTDQQASLVAAVVVGALVLASFVFTVFVFRRAVESISWAQGPIAWDLIEVASEHGEGRVRLWLAERLVASYVENDAYLEQKARWFSLALWGAIVQGFVTTGGLVAIVLAAATG